MYFSIYLFSRAGPGAKVYELTGRNTHRLSEGMSWTVTVPLGLAWFHHEPINLRSWPPAHRFFLH